ncbi:MAG: restriction endonuclease subunit S [gamma proteobacterium endosymbiont of Lamellibrachia anaximandri]|nr:restriction endonuclease subunit S [gamma proteobacterium endosymbiont of Lamellibrachia anaximandri]
MSSSHIGVPESWCTATLNDVYQIFGGGTPTTTKPEYWGGETPWITSADIEGVRTINVRKFVTEKGIENSTTTKAPTNSLLVVTRVGLGKIAIIKEETCFSQDLQALVMSDDLLVPEYTLYLLSYKLQFLKYEGRGTTISGLTKKQLKDLKYPLPPFNEQHRIVAKIEELFSEQDKGIESLKTAREQLKVYRQALLKHAFEGKLTEQWRKERADAAHDCMDAGGRATQGAVAEGSASVAGGQEPGATKLETADQLLERIKQEREARYHQQLDEWKAAVTQWEADGKDGKKPAKPRQAKLLKTESNDDFVLPDLPNSWVWLVLGENNIDVFDGPFGSNLKTSDYVDEGIRVIRLENIGAQQFIDEKKSFISEAKYQQIEKHTVRPGDLVFSSFVTENTRVARVPDTIDKAVNKADCFCIRTFGNSLDERFLEAFLSSRFVFKHIEGLVHGVGRPRINTTQLKSIPIPMTSIEEQREIMEKLETQFSEVSQLEKDIDFNLAKSEALRQSILKKAFSGQLVPLDPDDEPASVLLNRIAKEKDEAAAKAKKAKAAKKKPAREKVI